MSIRTAIRRGRVAIPLAIVILAGPLLANSADSSALILQAPSASRLGCAVSSAIGVDRVHVLQLPGDLPLHLRLRLRGCEQSS